MWFSCAVRVLDTDGAVNVTDNGISLTDATEVTLALYARSSYNGYDASPNRSGKDEQMLLMGDLDRLDGKTYDELLSEHVADYSKLYGRVTIDLGGSRDDVPTDQRVLTYDLEQDHGLAGLVFLYGRYLMIAGSRPGTQPLNLQGIWNEEVIPPWCCAYTTNINTEMNYWPAELTNLSECHELLFDLIEDCVVNGAVTARETYGLPGWVTHHNVTAWRNTDPVDGNDQVAMWNVCAGWFCQHLWRCSCVIAPIR